MPPEANKRDFIVHARDTKAWRTDRAHVRHAIRACGLADEVDPLREIGD